LKCKAVIDQLRHWLAGLQTTRSPIVVGLALVVFVLSFLAGMVVILVLPANYFVRGKRAVLQSQPVRRLALLVLRNMVGLLVFLVGLVMALPLVPGPGVLFILIGLGLIDFPGKRSLQLRLLRQPRVLQSVNGLRARFGRQPLQTGESDSQSVVDRKP
jgi:hypothetical protein